MATEESGGVDLLRLSLEQLNMLREQVSKDIERLTESFTQLQAAVRRFTTAGKAVQALGEKKEGTKTLIPMTGSLYVNGTLGTTDSVLIDIGTGYFLEKTTEGGYEYCQRKVAMLKESIEKLADIVSQKQQQTSQIQHVMELKVKANKQ